MGIASKSLFAIVVAGSLVTAVIVLLGLFILGLAGILAGSLYISSMFLLWMIKVILNGDL